MGKEQNGERALFFCHLVENICPCCAWSRRCRQVVDEERAGQHCYQYCIRHSDRHHHSLELFGADVASVFLIGHPNGLRPSASLYLSCSSHQQCCLSIFLWQPWASQTHPLPSYHHHVSNASFGRKLCSHGHHSPLVQYLKVHCCSLQIGLLVLPLVTLSS